MYLDKQTKDMLTGLVMSYNPKIPTGISPMLKQVAGDNSFIVFSNVNTLEVNISESVIALFSCINGVFPSTDSKGTPTKFYKLGEQPTSKTLINPIGDKPLDKMVDPHSGVDVSQLNKENLSILLWMKQKQITAPLKTPSAKIMAVGFNSYFETGDNKKIKQFLLSLIPNDLMPQLSEDIRLGMMPDIYGIGVSSSSAPAPKRKKSISKYYKGVYVPTVEDLVKSNQLKQAIEFIGVNTNDETLRTSSVLINRRLTNFESDNRIGVVSYDNQRVEQAQIVKAILSLLKD